MSLYERTLDAIAKFETFRNPDLSDWIKEIDPVLQARYVGDTENEHPFGKPEIGDGRVVRLKIADDGDGNEHLYIDVLKDGHPIAFHVLKVSILKAGDPARAARESELEERLWVSTRIMESSLETIEKCKTDIKSLRSALSVLRGQ